jgi:acetylornithine deacetylase
MPDCTSLLAGDRIDAWVEAHQAEIVSFLSRLVQIPSEVLPPRGSERAYQEFVAGAFRHAGAEVDIFTPDDVPGLRQHPAFNGAWDGMPREFTNRPTVVGVFRGAGGGRSLLFSTHADTVQAGDPEAWKIARPFSGEIMEGRLYGRGSWDTKWGIAASLSAVRCVRELGLHPRGDVIVESVCDEEFGGSHGALSARLRGYNADVAINAEPTSMVVCPAHRGGTAWKITVRGSPGRAFAGQRLSNPVLKLAKVIEALQAYDQERIPSEPPPFYRSDPALPTYIQQVNGGGSAFAQSIGLPEACSLSIWTEEHPGTDFETHSRRLTGFVNRYLANDTGFDGVFPEYFQQFRFIPGSQIDPGHPFFNTLEHSFASAGLEYRQDGAKFACDTYIFNRYSPTPALTLGPRGGNAHAGDEYVLLKDVTGLVRVYARAILEWCS